MATVTRVFQAIILAFSVSASAIAQETVNSGIVNSDQTDVVNDEGESIQKYDVGQPIYVVIDPKNTSKRSKDFYRVTFDPSNLKGDGWILKDKVKLMTGYHSIDGKEPKEYENKPQMATAPSKSSKGGSTFSGSSPTESSTFLEELIKKDEQKPEYKTIYRSADQPQPNVKKNEKGNALEQDLEFLFQQEGEFKKTYKETKQSLKASMQKKVGVSEFTSSSDAFASSVYGQFVSHFQKVSKLPSVQKFSYEPDLESTAGLARVDLPKDLSGVFFGQMSPKIGDSRLLKMKYYDRSIKQFTFEKVVKVPLEAPAKTIEALANDCYKFLSK